MAERTELEGKPSLTPHEITQQLVEQLRIKGLGNRLGEYFTWFPDPTRHQEIEAASLETKAQYTVSVLGYHSIWSDAVRYLNIYRPQDGVTTAEKLGLTENQAAEVYPLVRQVSNGVLDYLDYFIDNLLAGDLAYIASKLSLVEQADGLSMVILNRFRKQGQEKEANVQIAFNDGSKPLTSPYSKIYLSTAKKGLPIENASFDQQTNILSLQIPLKT